MEILQKLYYYQYVVFHLLVPLLLIFYSGKSQFDLTMQIKH